MYYIVDAYAWIEYFRGTPIGKRAAKIIDNPATELLTLETTLAVIKSWALRNNVPFSELEIIIRHNSDIVHLTAEDWLRASELRHEARKKIPDFGFFDALILAVQEKVKYKILTGDKHFAKFKNVVLLK
ncbi:MAG: PIN domain-containing protein [Candidatus Thermoplasmatota archaeon]